MKRIKVVLRTNGPTAFAGYRVACMRLKQGRIHGNPVADDWAGAVMRKPLEIQKCEGRTNGPIYRPTYRLTWQGVELRVRD